ncbi:Protein of unknown function (plasmid) [Magnetospira sp. QH-2]|nr:Protein of unknown function [Magnetospira sp. QH-2]
MFKDPQTLANHLFCMVKLLWELDKCSFHNRPSNRIQMIQLSGVLKHYNNTVQLTCETFYVSFRSVEYDEDHTSQ